MPETQVHDAHDDSTIPLEGVPRCAVCGQVQFQVGYDRSEACPGCMRWATTRIIKMLGLNVDRAATDRRSGDRRK